MEKLSTIQKREKLCDIYADERINGHGGGATHDYMIVKAGSARLEDDVLAIQPDDILGTIHFQEGARNDENAIPGVSDEALLEIVRDRLKGFQSGEFASRENACALTHIEEALMWLNRRVEDRIERNVLGTYNK